MKQKRNAGWAAALLSLMIALALPAAAQEDIYTEMPFYLRFSQETVVETVGQEVYVRRVYPDTANDEIDAQMRALIDGMTEENRERLPLDPATTPSYLDVGAVISRSGESVLSFLTLAEISREKEQLAAEFETRVYDVETGRLLALGDLFAQDSGVWTLLAQEVRRTLCDAFPGLEPDGEALDRLCREEAIREADFTLGAARLTLTYRADEVYPGKGTLLHVNVGYSRLREMMNDYGLRQTDNSRFPMLALTFDDGGARGSTRRVLDELRNYGAQATFFIVGEMIWNNHDNVLRQQNGNYAIQSHTYSHKYPEELGKDEALRDKQRMNEELGKLIGVLPTMMRAPGGHAAYYAGKEIGYPLIQWTLASGDSGNPHVQQIAEKVIVSADDGEIVLLHDLNVGCAAYTAQILDALTAQGYLFVTVEELFEAAGVELEENHIYYRPWSIEM